MITIGRNPNSDVLIDERWDTVSNDHAGIDKRDSALVFYDHSTNGTVINGQKLHNNNVEIYPDDKIMLAGVYELDWSIIKRFFPEQRRPTVTHNVRGGSPIQDVGRKTMALSDQLGESRRTEAWQEQKIQEVLHDDNYGKANTYTQAEIDNDISKWSWGGFFGTWLFALYHKKYWPIAIVIVGVIPYIGTVCALALCVYMGMKGRTFAWKSGKYGDDFDKFRKVQRKWAIGGLICFIVTVAVIACSINFILSIF